MAVDTDYTLSCALELLEITPDTLAAIQMSDLDVEAYFTNHKRKYGHGIAPNKTLLSVYDLSNTMDGWLEKQSDSKIAYALSYDVYNVSRHIKELVHSIASNLVYAYMESNKKIPNQLSILQILYDNEQGGLKIHNESDISYPANIASYVMSNLKLSSYIQRIYEKIKILNGLKVPFQEIVNVHNNLLENNKNKITSTKITKLEQFDNIKILSKRRLFLENKGRRVLKKSVNKFNNLYTPQDFKNFMNGKGFLVEGKEFNWLFRQKPNTSIMNLSHSPLNGHIPYQLTIVHKNGAELADVCVYIAGNTPIVDQIISVSLFVKHDEETLLQKSNFFNIREENISLFRKIVEIDIPDTENEFLTLNPLNSDDPALVFGETNRKVNLEFDILMANHRGIIEKQIHKIFGFSPDFMNFIINQNFEFGSNIIDSFPIIENHREIFLY